MRDVLRMRRLGRMLRLRMRRGLGVRLPGHMLFRRMGWLFGGRLAGLFSDVRGLRICWCFRMGLTLLWLSGSRRLRFLLDLSVWVFGFELFGCFASLPGFCGWLRSVRSGRPGCVPGRRAMLAWFRRLNLRLWRDWRFRRQRFRYGCFLSKLLTNLLGLVRGEMLPSPIDLRFS